MSVINIIKECYYNRERLIRLAIYDLKSMNSGTVFGFLWNFLNPALQIFVYWFVFAIGLKANSPQGQYPYLIWMIVGIMPWFFISSVLMASTTSIFNYRGILKRMKFPLAIVPIKVVFTHFFSHIFAMCVVMLIFFLSGYKVGINFIYVFYYAFAAVVFLMGYSLLVSAITVLFKDFQKIMASIVRLLFYISPIVWSYDKLDYRIARILKLNPFAYILNGYRNSILYNVGLEGLLKKSLYYWGVTITLFVIGCIIHNRFKNKFIDII